MPSLKRRDPVVALLAVASNEAAYIGEWLFHHLQFGFAPILVLTNRCDDDTEAAITQVTEIHHAVRYENIDHLDRGVRGRNFQIEAYQYGIEELKRQLGSRDYIAILDIDEFWVPVSFPSSIQEILSAANFPAIAAFNWFMLYGDTAPFSPLFAAELRGRHNAHIKSAFRSRIRFDHMTPHSITPRLPCRTWTGSGVRVAPLELKPTLPRVLRRSISVAPPDKFGVAFIAHRLYRSPIEYLASLGKPRASNSRDASLFKSNRWGYHHHMKLDLQGAAHGSFSLGSLVSEEWNAQFNRFLDETGLRADVTRRQQHVLDRARRTLETYFSLGSEERKEHEAKFDGLDLDQMADTLGVRLP